ncbi:MAG: hypothetical protein R2839_09795 [Thermomicrobiales bacterium]
MDSRFTRGWSRSIWVVDCSQGIWWAPLRRDADVGLVVRLHHEPPEGVKLRPLTGLVKPEFLLSDTDMEIVLWLARETASTSADDAAFSFPARYRTPHTRSL